ncbi:hypothetical protein [Sphingobium sp. HDIP04]|uniref:hypothetical protein n=1 Tax=Sphingobium sp. HDIP04 TaxID=428994 RepID=UPI0003879FE1|nr:hypothetical protein [Sphingobium sp. HDIP04]EQA97319.1 hypothetical protein L286_23630 [Sphingobium sp. HDIP04]
MADQTPPPPLSAEEQELMITLAYAFRLFAKELLDKTPADGPLVWMSMGFAAMSMAFDARESDADALMAAEIFAQSSRQSMADMVAGQESHQVLQ